MTRLTAVIQRTRVRFTLAKGDTNIDHVVSLKDAHEAAGAGLYERGRFLTIV